MGAGGWSWLGDPRTAEAGGAGKTFAGWIDRTGGVTIGPTRTTLRPDNLTAWTPVANVQHDTEGTDGFTYPNPVLLPAERNRVYWFWRGADGSADLATREPDGDWARPAS